MTSRHKESDVNNSQQLKRKKKSSWVFHATFSCTQDLVLKAYPNPQSYNLYSPSDLPHLFPLSTFQMQERLLLPLGVYGYG